MIPASDITKWGVDHPWPTRDHIEQDFLLSQAICEIANDSLLDYDQRLASAVVIEKLLRLL